MLPALSRDSLLKFCRKMLLIRHFEEALIMLHNEGRFRGHYHVYIGQEATGVPALSLLQAEDYVFTTHRNHGHILARGADPGRMLAEILGRRDGYNKGKGGSFHVAPVELGFLQTSAVVAGILPRFSRAGGAHLGSGLRQAQSTGAPRGDTRCARSVQQKSGRVHQPIGIAHRRGDSRCDEVRVASFGFRVSGLT